MKFIFFTSLLLTSCIQVSNEYIIDKNYYLHHSDIEDNRTISYKLEDGSYLGLIEGKTLSFKNYKKYILCKQQIKGSNWYFIVQKINNQYKVDQYVFGPFNKKESYHKVDSLIRIIQ